MWKWFKRSALKKKEELIAPWVKENEKVVCFRTLSESLRKIVHFWEAVSGRTQPCVWIPAYYENTFLKDVRGTGATLVFYPVEADFSPNWLACEALATNAKPHILIFAHRYGFEFETKRIKTLAEPCGALIVEDATDVLEPQGEVGERGHITLYRPDQFLPISPLVLAVLKPGLKRWAKKTGDQSVELMSSHNISGKDQARWSKALAKWPQLAKTLVNHRGAWEAVLRKQGLSMETSLRPALSASTAFFRANEGAKWRAELQQQKWPLVPSIQLPPEVIQDPATYNVALSLATEGIVLPLQGHFSFRTFAKRFGQKVRLDPQYSMELVSHVEDWNALYSKVLYSDLLQSWSYARAKETTGWKAKPYVFLKNQEPIALAHVLEKKKLGITVGRVNRGPLWIKPLSSTEDLSQIYALLRAKYSLFKSKVLVVAPHLLTQADHHLSLRELGFRRLKRHASWQSIWVDLQQPEESLRRALKSNWRCPLAAAEKKNLIFRKMDFAHRWPFFLDQYERFKKNKFSGIASSFLQAMGEEIEKNKDIEAHIYEVFQEDNPIVSALVIRHGRCATYLAVWAEEAARRVSASNFLVWNIMMNLKQEGCELFDFGGISDSSTEAQDIAAFKRGVGGLEYELVGEFCSL